MNEGEFFETVLAILTAMRTAIDHLENAVRTQQTIGPPPAKVVQLRPAEYSVRSMDEATTQA